MNPTPQERKTVQILAGAQALFQTATVQPVVDFTRLEIVLVIVNFQPLDLTPLLTNP